jgi:SAM-dependent methyltransferase
VTADPTARFSDRVADYVKYRPSYPYEAIDAIAAVVHLAPGARIADIGSGTGISSKLFVERGFEVVGVEPNREMRAAAEAALGTGPPSRFQSVDGTAEHTGLEDASVALAVAAQAFHWFRPEEAQRELRRVIAAPHWVALMWNERLTDTPFLRDYEAALHEHSIDYAAVNHMNIDRAALARFFAEFETFTFPNAQRFDRVGLIGRALSSSYVPQRGHPNHDATMAALEEIFAKRQVDGFIEFRYATSVHVGTV